MVTVRWYVGTHEKVLSDLDKLKNDLKKNNIVYEKLIVEFCIYDTKVSHDFKWLKKENNE
jgi:hypothetical protein